MLEGLVAWVLNNYLGQYVENLNTAQLSIALLSGEVELENLPLKRDALRHLGFPVQIKAGFIGKIKLQIPVRQIKSAPWVVQIEQLYLVATPLPVQEWDHETEELIAHEDKLSALDGLEARWRLENDTKDASTYYASSYSSWLSYGTGFITDIIENLQLKIRDVHIRYEDSISIPGSGVAFGITMESLSAQSCDANWQPGFSHWDSSNTSFKLLEMQKLAMYWMDLDYDDLLANNDRSQLAAAMTNNETSFSKQCILAPVSAQAKFKQNRSEQPLRSDDPRLVCDLELEEVPMILVDWQYDQIIKCIKGLDDVHRFRTYRKFRPRCSVAEEPRAWWFYAISCLYPGKQPEICKPKLTLVGVLERWKSNLKYVSIYSKILIMPTIALPVDEKTLKDEVEWTRNFVELKVLREIAMTSVPVPNRASNWSQSAGGSTLVRWFPQWMGWYSSNTAENQPAPEATQLEGEILQALSDSVDNNTLLKRDAVFGRFSFILKSGTLSLCTTREDTKDPFTMLELQFKNLSLNIVSKPRTASHLAELSLGALYLFDKVTPKTLFPILIGPPGNDRTTLRTRGPSPRVSVTSKEYIFHLIYEKKVEANQYKLSVKTNSLDVVYQPTAMRWLIEFLCLPHQRLITQMQIEAMKSRTKRELMKNWEQIMDSRISARKNWELHLDISAPQIFFVEQFHDKNSAVAVIDFGRLQLRNNNENPEIQHVASPDETAKVEEDDEMYMTPCSTPPASEESDIDESDYQQLTNFNDNLNASAVNEASLHMKIYDRYTVELTDMQILVARVKDNWRHAHNKGTSTLHVLDRFNISLQIERRVIHTYDPSYPNLTLNANLPKLVAHLNEYKISAARKLAQIITATGLPSPFNAPSTNIEDEFVSPNDDDDTLSLETSMELSRLLILQFTVDHLALEVQSRGRSVAELQVSGVKFGFTKRPSDINLTLSVHSLLLVDALQTFGPDFELLIASHKHVGMDSMSGSLRDSEPTSPTSPGSPDHGRMNATSPVALTLALSSLATSPPPNQNWNNRMVNDSEALISLDLILVFGVEAMQIANIQFNNLDIIANQETIVELMGFIRRVFPELKSQKPVNTIVKAPVLASTHSSNESLDHSDESAPNIGTTEITFDFHRLNVLLLRGVIKDGQVFGKKICTSTMSDARIQATVSKTVTIQGSLGGLQVHDLTPDGYLHQRIVSVGRDPLCDTTHPLYSMANTVNEENTAFSFKIVRTLQTQTANDEAQIKIRMASLWYTHSPHFVLELQSCATEFKQYMANLARSIRVAATDMALGLVHARAEALAQSIYMNSRLSASIYGSALSFTDITSPRKRRRSSSMDYSFSGYSSVRDTCPQTPYTPMDGGNFKIDIDLDIVLDSPVLVLPRASSSTQVFVAHLGKIRVNNTKCEASADYLQQDSSFENYYIEVRDMNLYSLDTENRRVPGPLMSRPDVLYACDIFAKPILHDTIIELKIVREIFYKDSNRQPSLSTLLIDDEDFDEDDENDISESKSYQEKENIELSGIVVNALKLSLTRAQYEQLLDTMQWLTTSSNYEAPLKNPLSNLSDITEEDTGVTTLNMDPQVRAKLFSNVSRTTAVSADNEFVSMKVIFELPDFTIELRGDSPTGEQGLVDLSFRDFNFIYDKGHLYETNIHVSLRSIYMEDLLQPEGSKQRAMVISSTDEIPAGTNCVSRSCPDIYGNTSTGCSLRGSLPDHLETYRVLGLDRSHSIHKEPLCKTDNLNMCPNTPPPSPSRSRPVKNLVLISTLLVDSKAPNFETNYNSVARSTSVDFNCLDLVINVESWVVVIDFFGASPSDQTTQTNRISQSQVVPGQDSIERTNITVRSLTMVLVKPDRDIGRANISNVEISIRKHNSQKEVEGKLGSMSLLDLTSHGSIYRERFMTSGKQALTFKYMRHGSEEIKEYDSQLILDMSSVIYVHTKRFVVELQAFFNHFTQLQTVMAGIRAATSGQTVSDDMQRFSIVLTAQSPVIVLPLSSKSSQLIIVDLEHLKVTNSFKYSGDSGTISEQHSLNESKRKCLLDVKYLDLKNVNLQAGEATTDSNKQGVEYQLGNYCIRRSGDSLLTNKCHLKIQVESNLHSNICHNVPDMSIHGELSTLDGTLDLSQYGLIRGFLAHNLGENTEHILPSVQAPPITAEPNIREVWTLSSLKLDLLNVVVRLQQCKNTGPLACINFIKSRLTVETTSNMSQDIDLVSQEILILDTRFSGMPRNKQSNVFTKILQPIKSTKQDNLVQVEIHSRKRHDRSKFTILLNNMRLMAVFDWWALAKEFIFQDIQDEPPSPSKRSSIAETNDETESVPFELKLNITDSEVVVLEDTSVLETNAVILKSTTVITYRSAMIAKPLSCNLNNCEVYSCIFDKAEETALSIIDPVTLNIEINKDKVLDIQLQTINVRLSYFDMMMFSQILNSLPNQLFSSRQNKNSAFNQTSIDKLKALGFKEDDCLVALLETNNKLDDAALWLTQNALPRSEHGDDSTVCTVEFKANKIFLCIIDDCGDSDVPLLEVSLSSLYLRQDLATFQIDDDKYKGALECVLAADYFNRVLSGWEPIVEPWRCLVTWGHSLSQNLSNNRLEILVESKETLNLNVTSTFIELYTQVRDSWMQDFYSPMNKSLAPLEKRRKPFVPYVIRNETGSPLYYNTIIAAVDDGCYDAIRQNDTEGNNWKVVQPDQESQFSFKTRDKIRHSDTHKMHLHQLGVQIEGYQNVTPVTVDKVGVYFRQAASTGFGKLDVPMARVVFDVSLAGAKKLVTIRSALQLVNKLTDDIEIRLESRLPHNSATLWAPNKIFKIESNKTLSVPIVHAHSSISVRPLIINQKFNYSNTAIEWEQSKGGTIHDIKKCYSQRGLVYRFCAEVKREKYPTDRVSQRAQPAHTITLLPNILLVNLLPVDLLFSIFTINGRISPGEQTALSCVDTESNVEIKISLDNFPASNSFIVPSGTNSFNCRLRLEDNNARKLFLLATVTPHTEAKVKVIITSPYWIINKTGLPLIFRQQGVSAESAGQFSEHEVARMVSPLLFSFSDPAASNTVTCRVGTHVTSNGTPSWCQNFHLQRGVQVRKLRVSLRDNRPDVVFLVGIEIRQGRGKYRNTNIVTISPRYQLHNRSSYKLQFAQQCFTLKQDEISYIKAMPNGNMPFHWPRLDQELLLCVLIQDIEHCQWSGGLKIDAIYSMHVNIRNASGRMHFLRLEVVQQGATYFVIFTDADKMPPPIRIDNFSKVSVKFAQTCCKDMTLKSIARGHSSVPYAWDQPTKSLLLTLEAPGSVSQTYDMSKIGKAPRLTYENFIYIAFSGTFRRLRDVTDTTVDIENQELVLDVDDQKHIVLARKEHGQRSQLWRMTSTGQLQHEGSSPPSHPNHPRTENIFVLDIEGPAAQPSSYTRLVLRRQDPRRKTTQSWRFTEDGRLCCFHHNMYVQAQDGFFGLRQGNSAVLGLPLPNRHRTTETGIPVEQAIERQRLRPGSGFLDVEISTDGPTRVLSVWDSSERSMKSLVSAHEGDWLSISFQQRPIVRPVLEDKDDQPEKHYEYQFTVKLAGLGISLVSRRPPQELLYAKFFGIIGEVLSTAKLKRFCISMRHIQIDNQLFEAPTSDFLFVTPTKSSDNDNGQEKLSALEIRVEMQPVVNENAIIFDHLIVRLKKLTVHLEERLLLKLFEFIGYKSKDEEVHQHAENDYEAQRIVTDVTAHAKRYYFGIIQLAPDQIRLSMVTASKLSPSLQLIKRKAGLTFIKFEDAGVDLEPYVRQHSFDTIQVLLHSIVHHFKAELIWQAGNILGSVDFLGSPLGFMNDVSEGVQGFLYEGNIGALVKNVTHGISNSAAKVTESISDGLGKVTMDEEHEELRQKIRHNVNGSSGGHLLAGIKGFGFGMLGGATGIFKQIYEGASNEGIPGVFSGIGKGIVGAVTKPVVGVLDLASETARAVRDSSRRRHTPDQLRPPRCVVGPGGLLPCFSNKQSVGQQYLYALNDHKYSEMLVAYEYLRCGTEDLRVIITNIRICIVTSANSPQLTTVIESSLKELDKCRIIQQPEQGEIRHYIELIVRVNGASASNNSLAYQDAVRRPKVRCDSHEVAKLVTRQINYAKRLFDEGQLTLSNDNLAQSED